METDSHSPIKPLKIVVVAIGTRGDVQPYVALSKELTRREHQVILTAPCGFQEFIEANGIRYGYMNNFLLDLLESPLGKEAMQGGIGFFGFIKSAAKLWKKGMQIARDTMHELWEICEPFGPDLIIYHPKGGHAVDVAEKLEIPCMMAPPIPMLVPRKDIPAMGMPDLPLGTVYRKWSYSVVHGGYKMYDRLRASFRRDDLGLPPLPRKRSPITKSDGSKIPVLHAYSRHIIPHPEDWKEPYYTCGYWFLEEDHSEVVPDSLVSFLASGPPPVCVGFGSMSGKDPGKSARIAIESLRRCGLRGILITGWGGLEPEEAGEDMYIVKSVSHSWLFPQVKAVVHHGGAGTTAAVLKAGKPSVVCPFIIDQPFWGRILNRMGVAPKIIPHKRLTVKQLLKALEAIRDDTSLSKNAAAIGLKIRNENGVALTADLIERMRS